MASAVKPNATASASPLRALYRVFDAVYRFLASLKLAVITLSLLAITLSAATFFEATYGTAAAQEWIYHSRGFAVLLAFLGANILCAALIRYPWKKRQTGFVITHAGLLMVLGGSWYTLATGDEGEVVALEGQVKDELMRRDYPVIRVREIDPHDPTAATREWELPFRPGSFGWGPGNPPTRLIPAWLSGDKVDAKNPVERLTKSGDPFRFVVKSHIPSSVPARLHVPDPSGVPMVKIRPKFKAPGMVRAQDVFTGEEARWFKAEPPLYIDAKDTNPATGDPLPAKFSFTYVDRPELVEDFLNPPAVKDDEGVARIRYVDGKGKTRVYDWSLEGQDGKSITLPDSDLTVKSLGRPVNEEGRLVPVARLDVKKGDGSVVSHMGAAGLPMFPNLSPREPAGKKALIAINYIVPTLVDPKVNRLFGAIDVLGTPSGALFYRVYGRSDEPNSPVGKIRSKGPLKTGEDVVAFGGNDKMPMTLSFEVSDYLPAGKTKDVCEPLVLPKSKRDSALAASLVEMTVKDADGKETTREFYIRRSPTYEQEWKTVEFPSGMYQVAYDMERRPLGFEVKLDDFEVTFNPGTDEASSYISRVLLTDKGEGIISRPVTISMNETMDHRGHRFFQSSYIPEYDRNDRPTGRFQSVFHVGYNPGRYPTYLGCCLVVLGAFIQFYMRSGVFNAPKLVGQWVSNVKGAEPGHSPARHAPNDEIL